MAIRDYRFWAVYTSNHVRSCKASNNLRKLRIALNECGAEEYAIFEQKPGFHSTLQQEYLVEHKNVKYWINRGIPSVKENRNV